MNGRWDWRFIVAASVGTPLLLVGILIVVVIFFGGAQPRYCRVVAYQDLNCDGQPAGPDREPPLSGVCVWAGSSPQPPSADYCRYPENQADAAGQWEGKLSGRYYVVLQTPAGFAPTSDIVLTCPTSIFGYRGVGFASVGACPWRDVLTPEKWMRQRIAGYAIAGAVMVGLGGALVVVLRWRRGARPSGKRSENR